MTTPTAEKLKVYYASKQVAADNDPLPTYTADAACTRTLIKDAALVEAADYWNGAHGWFTGNVTAGLAGEQFHVLDFAGGDLTLYKNLSVAPAAGDTFKMVLGGGYASSERLLGMMAGSDQPEYASVTGTNITGLTINRLSPRLGEGTLSLFFDQSESLLFAKMGAEAYGVGVTTAGNPTNAVVFTAGGEAYVEFTIVTASLPVGDETDTFTTVYPLGTHTPDVEGAESAASANGKTRYRLEVARNSDGGGGVMVGATVGIAVPDGTATTLAGGESLGTGAGDFDATDASDWPTRGFWIKNTTKTDCRFVNYRSGNTIFCDAVEWATLAFDQGSVEIQVGDAIEDATSGATAVVDQIVVASGTWGTSDAAGTMLLKVVVGTFGNNNVIEVAAVPSAVCDGASALGLRGYTAVSWAAADAIQPMADCDIGLGTATVDQFETPEPETIAPDGVTFSDADISLGHLEDGDKVGIWRRTWITAGHQARADVDATTTYSWT